ncbi:MAG: winged helix-turn-helix transcriptional regulator [Gammaproteobacteria bacterium]|nr:winged helix-turn-helix transcriptional regulator [Gammaproteobacteria bacterium]
MREVILNAIIHKDYASSTPVQVSVYEDRLMIWNSGQLPDEWGVEDLLRKHPSKPYNPDIANAFFRAGMIESWGRGIERIQQSCREAGLKLPEFSYQHSDLWVVFHLGLSEKTSEKILQAIRENEKVTISELSGLIGVTTRSIERNIKKLQEDGVLERVGPARGGYWELLQ